MPVQGRTLLEEGYWYRMESGPREKEGGKDEAEDVANESV